MDWPTPEQFETYIKCADADLGQISTEGWVETVRHILRDLSSGKAKLSSGIIYARGGGSGKVINTLGCGGGAICKEGCRWEVIEGFGNLLTERCASCGSTRSRHS